MHFKSASSNTWISLADGIFTFNDSVWFYTHLKSCNVESRIILRQPAQELNPEPVNSKRFWIFNQPESVVSGYRGSFKGTGKILSRDSSSGIKLSQLYIYDWVNVCLHLLLQGIIACKKGRRKGNDYSSGMICNIALQLSILAYESKASQILRSGWPILRWFHLQKSRQDFLLRHAIRE